MEGKNTKERLEYIQDLLINVNDHPKSLLPIVRQIEFYLGSNNPPSASICNVLADISLELDFAARKIEDEDERERYIQRSINRIDSLLSTMEF